MPKPRFSAPGHPSYPMTALPPGQRSPPRLPTALVARSRLLAELDNVHSYPLTLVSASAGSGKTTLLSAWIAALGEANRRSAPDRDRVLAWLSLEMLDNDVVRFWASVIAALQLGLPNVGGTAVGLLLAPESPPVSTILTHLLAEIEEIGRPVILVLDDYHVIDDPGIQESMLFFIDHLPATLHLVLATRSDPVLPLSRWRLRGQLLEVRDGDLRFSQDEAASFLLQSMGLALSDADVLTLQRRTEGWIAGLQLAALSLRKQRDPSGFVQHFAGSYRYLLDYVQQDILTRLPAPLYGFLLQTSIATRMNASLCQAITASSSPQESQNLLEEAERANLFLVPLDEERKWYRYHDLFREALHNRLHATQPEQVPGLHVRAAKWYEAQGEWREAVAHALEASDFALAVSLMERAAPLLWRNGEARAVQGWILALPDAIFSKHAELAFNAALHFIDSVHISTETLFAPMAAQVERTVSRMRAILRDKEKYDLAEADVAFIRRRLVLIQALIEVRAYFRRGDKQRLRLLAEKVAAEPLPQDEMVSWKMIPLTFTFWLTLARYQHSALLIPTLRSAKQWISDGWDRHAEFRVMTWLARAYIHAGELRLADQECREALLLSGLGGDSAVAGYLYASQFDISYAWNHLDDAAEALHHVRRIAGDWQQIELLAMAERAAVQLALAQGDLQAAEEAMRRAQALLKSEQFANNARWVVDACIRVWLAKGNLDEAKNWADSSVPPQGTSGSAQPWQALLLARIALTGKQYDRAVELLEAARDALEQPTESRLDWMALYTIALHHSGRKVEAARVAERLLALTRPSGYIRLYVDLGEPMQRFLQSLQAAGAGEDSLYIARLLAAFTPPHQAQKSDPRIARQPGPAEPLSRQELRVLRLLASGQTYAEMAAELTVSTNTIKTQVTSVYRKLGIHRRAEAIQAAARFHLL